MVRVRPSRFQVPTPLCLIHAEYSQDDNDHDDHANNVENAVHGYPFAVGKPRFRLIVGLARRLGMTLLYLASLGGPNVASHSAPFI
jgi:hypothetical protein